MTDKKITVLVIANGFNVGKSGVHAFIAEALREKGVLGEVRVADENEPYPDPATVERVLKAIGEKGIKVDVVERKVSPHYLKGYEDEFPIRDKMRHINEALAGVEVLTEAERRTAYLAILNALKQEGVQARAPFSNLCEEVLLPVGHGAAGLGITVTMPTPEMYSRFQTKAAMAETQQSYSLNAPKELPHVKEMQEERTLNLEAYQAWDQVMAPQILQAADQKFIVIDSMTEIEFSSEHADLVGQGWSPALKAKVDVAKWKPPIFSFMEKWLKDQGIDDFRQCGDEEQDELLRRYIHDDSVKHTYTDTLFQDLPDLRDAVEEKLAKYFPDPQRREEILKEVGRGLEHELIRGSITAPLREPKKD